MIITRSDSSVKDMTLSQFKESLNNDAWLREMCSDITDSETVFIDNAAFNHQTNAFDMPLAVVLHSGWRGVNSTLLDFGIFYVENVSFYEHQHESFKVSESIYDKNWCFQGVPVVNENGGRVTESELIACLPESFSTITLGAKDMISEPLSTCSIDINTDETGFRKAVFKPTYRLAIQANVKEIGAVCSNNVEHLNDGGCINLSLYETAEGNYVCSRVFSLSKEDKVIKDIVTATSLNEVKAFFGNGAVAEKLYEEARI